MATADVTDLERDTLDRPAATSPRVATSGNPLKSLVAAFASLKLTVALLVALTFLVMAGTLAQANHDVWYVVREGYFRVWFAFIEFQNLPVLIGVFKPNNIQLPGGFYFPGGYIIGGLMALNLLAAHSRRFKISAKGNKLVAGLALLGVGAVVTTFVVMRAMDAAYEASISPAFADQLWNWLRGGLAGIALAGAYVLSLAWGRIRRPEWFALAAFVGALIGIAGYLFWNPQWQIDDSGMRIVWQLLQSTAAGGLLMASCWLLFGKRAGVVLLHSGIALLMLHEFYTAVTAVEANMMIAEGETANYVFDNRESELALIDQSGSDTKRVVVVPNRLLATAAAAEEGSPERVISHPDLPVDVRVLNYYQNSNIRGLRAEESPLATSGAGTQLMGEQTRGVSGLKGEINIPLAYIELLDKESGDSIETLLVTNYFDPWLMSQINPRQLAMTPGMPASTGGEQPVEIDGKPFAVAMRFRRIYKPYSVTLENFEHNLYQGTQTAKNFSSQVQLVDHTDGTVIDYKIFMNNPLRYKGETFYQADWNKHTDAGTVLQVVKNEGWMLPYVSCAVVMVGMLVHFGLTLLRFLNRRADELNRSVTAENAAKKEGTNAAAGMTPGWLSRPEVWVPALIAIFTVGYLASKFRGEEIVVDNMVVSDFATLPVVDEGRVKPYDTLARNLLQYFAQRQEADTTPDGKNKIPAAQWLLDVASGKPEAHDYYIFRITNLELLDTLELPRRNLFYRYTPNEIDKNIDKLVELVQSEDAEAESEGVDEPILSPFQKQSRQLLNQRIRYGMLVSSFQPPQFSEPESLEALVRDFMQAGQVALRLDTPSTPRTVPPAEVDGNWFNLFEADLRNHCDTLREVAGGALSQAPVMQPLYAEFGDEAPGPGLSSLASMLAAYREGNEKSYRRAMKDFRGELAAYQAKLEDPSNEPLLEGMKKAEKLNLKRVDFEAAFNAATPFYYCAVFYLFALLLSAASWLGWSKTLGRSAVAIILVTLLVHTLALAARMYISGRPPITNLYTTAIFIGWAVVLIMMELEWIYKLGIGSFIASGFGFATLMVAHYLALDEDTFTVLQAVLDTQFWLTTHVISINLGYATTMLAGCIGLVYIVMIHLLGMRDKKVEHSLARMIYGTLCFAILFSFVGTVLGGLWADDSWGRFWGWDPKENGALMIVLWNAVALHARWGKMVGTRGLALIAIFGNIITAWSWFGVNQLGQGLHNYGFDDGLAAMLGGFVLSQLAFLILGLIPWRDAKPIGEPSA